MDSTAYCEERIAARGTPLALALGFAAPGARAPLAAVHALEAELRDVAENSSDPGVGRARTAWWASELAAALEGNPAHPVTVSLAATMPVDALAGVNLAALLDAVAAMAVITQDAAPRPLDVYASVLGAATGSLGALAGGWQAPGIGFAGDVAGARIRLELASTHDRGASSAAARAACDAVPPAAQSALVDQLILAELELAGAFRTAQAGRAARILGALRGPWIAWRTAVRARRGHLSG